MAFIRLSLMTPKPGQGDAAEKLVDELVQLYQDRQGFIGAYRLQASGQAASGQLGRISIWESEADANRMASEERDIALQSRLKLIVDEDTHDENSFEGTPTA